jgi:AcrR family transcriptional regulator
LGASTTTPKIGRKRQARGEAQIKNLLKAAEVVFAREGYYGATTNEISATAQVSPATLYQFFRNKEEIANALTLRYADQMGEMHDKMDLQSFSRMNLTNMVSAIMDPLFNFHKSHPAFLTLLLDAPLSKETMAAKHAIMEKFLERLATMFRLRNPKMKPADADWAAQVSMIIYKGFCPEIKFSSGATKQRLMAEFKALMVNYLEDQLD